MTEPKKAFTLIELLAVISIIVVLVAVLVPSLGTVQKSVKKAASRARFNQWATAIEAFKQEYGYYPWTETADSDTTLDLSKRALGITFVETLSGRNANGDPATSGGNRKALSFYTFSNSDFFHDSATDTIDENTLVDAFNNDKIMLVIDSNEDGRVLAGPNNEVVRVSVAIWTLDTNPDIDSNMTVRSWE